VASVDDWFHFFAGQNERRDVTRSFVAFDDSASADSAETVLGFYCLTVITVAAPGRDSGLAVGGNRYPVAAALIGQLGVDHRAQGEGVGSFLVKDALARITRTSHNIGIALVVVEAVSPEVIPFSQRAGFQPFAEWPSRLFLSLKTLRASPVEM
jgi:GNAT superfamily N-acetyltransferase